ncbi:MAG TPA: metallophosphoesterase, partial [Thermomicrobiales bacterium]|nr:metallophosphoesterase [Thermomicrobiales bacterium]
IFGYISLFVVAIGIPTALYARFVAPFRLRITHLMVQLPRTHRHLDGTTLAFVTDTHVGPHFSAKHLEPVVRILRRAHPDVVLFGGDYISESPRYVAEAREPLAAMASTAVYGAWGILGNHDIANIRQRVLGGLADTGITFLQNDATQVTTQKGTFWIAGVDDILLGKDRPAIAFEQIPADALTIALWHEADHAERMEPFGPLLMLSGHSHGGQIRLPWIGAIAAPKLGKKYDSGRYEIGNMTLYVSNGIGMYRPPVRLNCPPEVVLVKLIG